MFSTNFGRPMKITHSEIRGSCNGYISIRSRLASFSPNPGESTILEDMRVIRITSFEATDGHPRHMLGVFGVGVPFPCTPSSERKDRIQKSLLAQWSISSSRIRPLSWRSGKASRVRLYISRASLKAILRFLIRLICMFSRRYSGWCCGRTLNDGLAVSRPTNTRENAHYIIWSYRDATGLDAMRF